MLLYCFVMVDDEVVKYNVPVEYIVLLLVCVHVYFGQLWWALTLSFLSSLASML